MPIERIPKESILAVIGRLGPCQPIDIRKDLKLGDTFLIGALLSELVADGKLAITKVKRGGSPFYYDIQKPETLDAVSKYLNEKDRRTYAMLKAQKVMREDSQDPLVRVGLQNMPDFSRRAEIDGVAYWRYFLTSEEDAKRIATGKSTGRISKSEEEKTEGKQEMKEETKEKDEMIEETKEEKQKETTQSSPSEKPKRSRKKTKEEPQKEIVPTADSAQQTLAKPGTAAETATEKTGKPTKPARKGSSKKVPVPVIMPDGAVMISPQEWLEHDTLYARVQAFSGGMQLRDARVHKPHAELTCVMTAAVPFGSVDVFVHAFNRKFTPDDVKATLPAARELGMPVLILSVDPMPSKVTSAFKGMPNIMFKQL